MKLDGMGFQSIFPTDEYHNLDFRGWIDDQTFAIADYEFNDYQTIEDDNWVLMLVDANTRNVVRKLSLGKNGMTFEPNDQYIPAVSSLPSPDLLAIPKIDTGIVLSMTTLLTEIPAHSMFRFEDWQPGTNTMLANWFVYTDTSGENLLQAAHLFQWNIAEMSAISVIPGGISAQFSPDGSILAFTSFGAIGSGLTVPNDGLSPIPIDPTLPIYLQLQNRQDGQIFLSLPIESGLGKMKWNDQTGLNEFFQYREKVFFSPDGHYLSFFTTGPVSVDENGWPRSLENSDSVNRFLNILDLREKKLLYSLPTARKCWSGTNNDTQFIYQNPEENWVLIDLTTRTITPITLQNGKQLSCPSWSFDDQYLLFHRFDTTTYFQSTIILSLPK
jgi:Tol biopolymer transport system component